MSLSALPEWKQLLLERKRREEEERERREREEEERLASMPAWKRGIIQRRRAKQDEERERERDGGQQNLDVLGITEDGLTDQTDIKLTIEQTGYRAQKQISKETICPIQQNPFIRSENSFRRDTRGKEVGRDGEGECKKATLNSGRESNREMEIWKERDGRMGCRSEGRERDRSTGRESKEAERSTSPFPGVVGLRTIQANNIIIIEKDKNGKERPEMRDKEVEEDEKRMRMDLREFLAGGGSVTEIRASEVLIIKPPVTDGKWEVENPDRGSKGLGKEGLWNSVRMTSRAVMQKAERVLNHKDRATPECSGRVSQLLSKFGEHPKPPMRSKSTECFNPPGKNRARYSTGDLFVPDEQKMEETETSQTFRGVPKRSFSFSDRVVCQQENRDCEEKGDFKVVERTLSDRRVKTRVNEESETQGCKRWGRSKHDEVMHEKRQKERKADNKRSACGETEVGGFTVAAVKKPEGVAFARRIPIRQDGRESSSEREIKRVREEIKVDKEIHRDEEQELKDMTGRPKELQTEAKKESERSWNQDEASQHSHGSYVSPTDDSNLDYIGCQCVNTSSADSSCSTKAYAGQRQTSVLNQHTENLLCKIGKVKSDRELKRAAFSHGDTERISSEMSNQEQLENHQYQSVPKRATEEVQFTSQLPQQAITSGQLTLNQHTENLLCKTGKAKSDREFKRAAFSHEDIERISNEMSNQEQLEHQYQSVPKRVTEEVQFTSQLPQQVATPGQSKLCNQEGVVIPRTVFYGVDMSAERRRVSLPTGDKEDGGLVQRRGSWKAGRPLTRVESLRERIRQQEKERQKSREDEKEEDSQEGTAREQEETTLQTLRLFDVTQDASMAKSSPQLPVPVSLSLLQSDSTEREVTRDVSESDICLRETERETKRYVEETGTCDAWRKPDGEDKRESEEELLEEDYLPPSLSPSPPLSDSLDAMSRIYNLKTVGSRTAVCISERTADLPPHSGPQGKYNPIRQPSPDILPEKAKLWRDGEKTETMESTGVQMVQRQVERLHLRQQEAGCGAHNDRKSQPITDPEVKATEGQKRPDILRETQKSPASPRFPQAQKTPSKPQQGRSFTINARTTELTETSPKIDQSSPSSLSPCTASPSSTPSPPLFSIRSASGGPGKRGTTITITPRRVGVTAPSAGVPTVAPVMPKSAPKVHTSTPAPISTREAGKKRYPTAEEIEVIGGYQNLERSCLVKNRGTTKAVKVCFDEARLERVCEYPSEDCALASLPGPPQDELDEADPQDEDEEDDSQTFVSRADVSSSAGRARFLKVDESCKRLSK